MGRKIKTAKCMEMRQGVGSDQSRKISIVRNGWSPEVDGVPGNGQGRELEEGQSWGDIIRISGNIVRMLLNLD
jgi:hypothetical protein